jgi:hypothetical protein
MDAHAFNVKVANSTNEGVNELRFAYFCGLRLGLEETGRMEYNDRDPLFIMISKAERIMMDAMQILKDRDDPVARQRTADRSAR